MICKYLAEKLHKQVESNLKNCSINLPLRNTFVKQVIKSINLRLSEYNNIRTTAYVFSYTGMAAGQNSY